MIYETECGLDKSGDGFHSISIGGVRHVCYEEAIACECTIARIAELEAKVREQRAALAKYECQPPIFVPLLRVLHGACGACPTCLARKEKEEER